MGYHVELVASPPRPILWDELSAAGRALGWQVSDADQDIVLMQGDRLVSRLNFSKGEAWVKSPDDETLSALIDLAAHMGLRARGDEFESYRSLTEWYVHPDDEKAHAEAAAPSALVQRRLKRQRIWNLFRIAVLFGVLLPMFAFKVYMDFR